MLKNMRGFSKVKMFKKLGKKNLKNVEKIKKK